MITLVAVYFPRPGEEARADPPAVRRQGELRFEPGEAYDLDSLATDWVPTRGAWFGQDAGYVVGGAHDWIVGLNAESGESGDSVAALDPRTPKSFDSCVKADYGAKKSAPRDNKINPERAVCVLTTEERYALVEIVGMAQTTLVTRVTVWEKK
ncbi:hypothetical protein [Streptosporangium sp. NPDC020145]|uniref:hypothetical protein n=1 Tax=Streptosporangium sp. NPDC020145 TaxID=3154694 RepID=UPI0034196DC5